MTKGAESYIQSTGGMIDVVEELELNHVRWGEDLGLDQKWRNSWKRMKTVMNKIQVAKKFSSVADCENLFVALRLP